MRRAFILLWILQPSFFCWSQTQIIDDFTDGEITNSPIWLGDISNFSVNTDQQLQLTAPPVSGKSYISTSSEVINEAEWSFYVKLDFNPSSGNYLDVYLVSDQENLKGELNGYFVRIGSTQDDVCLYKQNQSTKQKMVDGTDHQIDASQVLLHINVTKNADNTWELQVDYGQSGLYISEGTAVDDEHLFSGYFGLLCTYTSTRADKFFFDDLYISGKNHGDDRAPGIDAWQIESDSSIQITYSEKVTKSTAEETSNYLIDNGIENPLHAWMSNDSTITLVFPQKFEDKASYLLTVTGVKDVFSNAMEKTDISFTYFASYLVDFNDLLITEIMADPSPGIDLPEYEYLEIFNPGTESYSVSNMLLVVGKDTAMMADFSILPGEYLIVCQSSAVDHFADFGRTMKVSNWPSLNNSGEPIALYNEKGKLVFSIAYDDSWYKSIEKDDGGWSLEMIDTRFPCKSSENWIASIDASGGTPGKPNAVSEALTDLSAPAISRVIVDSPTSAMVYLDEKIEPQAVSPDQVSVLPQLDILSILLNPQDFSSLKIEFATAILPNTKYELSIKNIHDCAGNVQKGTASSFVLPQMADSLDIIINEILFNPRPEGIDFVELYNQSDKYIDLSTLQIANDDDKKSITEAHLIIEPKQFVALTESAEVLHNQYPGIQPKNLLKVEKMPPFNDDEGSVILRYPDGKIVDFVQYADAYHSPFLNDSEGVSLERISFDSPSNKPDNWQSASATAGFATPGKINSQTLSGTAHSSPMHIEPPVFDPGGHGFPAFTIIKCRFANGGNMANLNIVDTQGRVVKTILSHQSVGVEEDFKWEGDNDEGQEVRLGPYIVFMEIYAADGSRHLYRKKVVVAGKRQ